MRLPYEADAEDSVRRSRFTVILANPENQENIGLVARAMKNTGFEDLRLVGLGGLQPEAYKTAVHAEDILEKAGFYPSLEKVKEDLQLIFSATARSRKTFSILPVNEAVETMLRFPQDTRIGLLFGNERTGLSSDELGSSNFVYSIPQARRQPSYNLASAVLLTLFPIFIRSFDKFVPLFEEPLPRRKQEDCIGVILKKLEQKGFVHGTNRTHITRKIQDLFGRLALTDKDRKLLMAVFNKAID